MRDEIYQNGPSLRENQYFFMKISIVTATFNSGATVRDTYYSQIFDILVVFINFIVLLYIYIMYSSRMRKVVK